MPVKGTYLAIAGGGIILLWSGLAGKNWTDVLRNVIGGEKPSSAPSAYAITGTNPGASGSGSGSAGDLAGNFETHLGQCYLFGGSAGTTGQGCWDCSSAMNYVANIQTGLPIPGSAPHRYNPTQHGPNTVVWLGWAPFHMQHIRRANVQRNDVIIWQTHMGVATDNKNYASAAGTTVVSRGHEGTVLQSIDQGGPSGEIPTFWRYR